jgi:shikimate dehydrogenase
VVPFQEAESVVQEATLIINTTSVGMYPQVEVTPIPIEWMHEGHIASDLIYNPRPTAWLKGAKACGARIHSGEGMLVHQAAIAIQHWFHRSAPVQCMKEVLIQSLSD